MLEPENNPNPSYAVDPPRPLRFLMAKFLSRKANTHQIEKKRAAFEKKRQSGGAVTKLNIFISLMTPIPI